MYIVSYTYSETYFILTMYIHFLYILLTKTTAAQNEVGLSYHSVRGLYFLAVVFVTLLVPDDVVTSKILDFYHINPVSSLEFAKRITKNYILFVK